jgi:hypothetical protein
MLLFVQRKDGMGSPLVAGSTRRFNHLPDLRSYPLMFSFHLILLLGRSPFWFNTPQLAAEHWGCEGFVPPHTQRFQGEILNTQEICSGDSLLYSLLHSCV